MTLLDLIHKIEETAKSQPQVGEVIGGDIYRLNERADALYSVFAWTQGQHTLDVMKDSTAYTFTLFYVDRLTADKSNTAEVQSVGIQVLSNILRFLMSEGVGVGLATFQPFTERFSDECAGVYCSVTLTVLNDYNCEQTFE